jgi:hypothetical protein
VADPVVASQSPTLQWIPPTETVDGKAATTIAGYRIHYGTNEAVLIDTIEVPNVGVVSYVVEGLNPGTYYFAVRAVDASGAESELSNVERIIIS